MNSFKFALREILRQKKDSLFYVLTMSLGFACFLTVQSYRNSIGEYVNSNKRKILSADIVISTRRHFSEAETKVITDALGPQQSIIRDFFAMASVGTKTKLVQTRAMDPQFPLYGDLLDEKQKPVRMTTTESSVWVSRDFQKQFSASIGDTVKLGKLNLKVLGIIEKDESQTFRSMNIAPRIYISNSLLKDSGLLQFGSTFTEALLYRIPEISDPEKIKEALYKQITDPGINIETASSSNSETSRQLGYLGDFLGLSALTSLLLASLGASFLFQLSIFKRKKDIAILRALGLQGPQAVLIYTIQGTLLALFSMLPTLFLAQLMIPFLDHFLKGFFNYSLNTTLSPKDYVVVTVIALLSGICISLPQAYQISKDKVSQLFGFDSSSIARSKLYYLLWLPGLCFLSILAVWATKSFFTAGIYLAAIAVSAIAIGTISKITTLALKALPTIKQWSFKYSLQSFLMRSRESLVSIITMGLAAFMMNLVPQIRASIQSEIDPQGGTKLPSLFLFDIQEEQLDIIKNVVILENPSPIIRARISKVNDLPFERNESDNALQTRDQEQEARLKNRAINISIREKLSPAESVTDGKYFEGTYDSTSNTLPEISVEKKYAKRVGLAIGDVVEFDIQGFLVKAKITSLRSVRWTSFQPNFFIIIQPGVLEDVPKVWIASISSTQDSDKIITELASQAPNVSVVNVESTIQEVLKTLDQMGQSLQFMALLTAITGLVILYSLTQFQILNRRWEVNMMKILGAGKSRLYQYLLFEQLLIVLLGVVPGACLSIFGNFFLSKFLFEGSWAINLNVVLQSIFLISLISIVVAYFAIRSVLKEKPLAILRANG